MIENVAGIIPYMNESIPSFITLQPVLATTILALIGGVAYLFGWIRSANDWQYQNNVKYGYLYHGFHFLMEFIVIPLPIFFFILFLLENSGLHITIFLTTFYAWVYLIILLILYLGLQKLDRYIMDKISHFEDPRKVFIGIFLAISGDVKYVIFLANYGLLLTTQDIFWKILLLLMDLLLLMKLARLSNLQNQGAEAIIVKRDKSMRVRLIEFVGKVNFLKVQEVETKKVLVIPVKEISSMELMEKKIQFNFFDWYMSSIDKIFGFPYEKQEGRLNPWCVFLGFLIFMSFFITIWFHSWIIMIVCIFLQLIRPYLFRKPKSSKNWFSKSVLGQEIWRSSKLWYARFGTSLLFTIAFASVIFVTYKNFLLLTIISLLLILIYKILFMNKMVQFYEKKRI